MGVVYKARHLKLNRVVALKMILSGGHASDAELKRFVTEAEAVAALQHPNIVQIFETGEHQGLPYFSLEYVDGGSLAAKVKENPLPTNEAAGIVEHLARGMEYAHRKGVVHRDLKPDNVLMTSDGIPKLTDFGLAKQIKADSGLTQTGAIMGTPSYMAPEQAVGKTSETGPAADVYGLGAILYRLVTGRPPFQAATALETIRQVVGDEPVAPTQLQSKTPRDLETIILKCLRKEPAKRFASAADLADDLRRFRENRPIVARPVGRIEKLVKLVQRNPSMTALVASIVLLILGLSIGGYARYSDAKKSEAVEGQRLARNSEAVAAALEQVEFALGADDALRAEPLLAQAEKRYAEGVSEELRSRIEQCRKDLAMLTELDRIDDYRWTHSQNVLAGAEPVTARWRRAFVEYGIEPGATPTVEAAQAIGRSLIHDRLLATLDTWLVEESSIDVMAILNSADPDAYRETMRQAVNARNADRVRAVAAQFDAMRQPDRFTLSLVKLQWLSIDERRRRLIAVNQRSPSNFAVLMTLASLHEHNNKQTPRENAEWYRAALALRPKNAAAHHGIAVALFKKGDLDGAIAEYREAIRLDPNYQQTHLNLADALRQKKDTVGAIAEYKEAIRLISVMYSKPKARDALTAPVRHYLGDAYRENDDPDSAIAEYREVLRLYPDYGVAQVGIGLAYRQKNDLDGAIAAFRKAIKIAPKSAAGYANLGYSLREMNDPDGAIAAYREAIRLDPNSSIDHGNLGIALWNKKDLDGAVAAYREAIRLDPKQSWVHIYLGLALGEKKDLDGAIAAYREAIRLDPNSASAHTNLGSSLRDKRDVEGAIAEYRLAIQIDPKFADAHNNLGLVLMLYKKDLDGAIAEFREATRLNPNLLLAYNYLGNAFLLKKDYVGAMNAYKEYMRLKPTTSSLFVASCTALAADGKGVNPPAPSERPELRRQVRDWLAREINSWRKKLDEEPAASREVVHRAIQRWTMSPDLAGIRDPERLKLLHPDEQLVFEKLWREVRALRDRSAPAELLPMPRVKP